MLPPVAQAFAAAGREELPLTVRDARRELGDVWSSPPPLAVAHGAAPVVSVEKAHLRRGDAETLRGASAGFDAGTVTAVLGENGAGKSSLALAAARLLELDRGRVRGSARAGYVSQNPAHHLLRETVEDEVAYGLVRSGVPAPERAVRTAAELERFGLAAFADRHPRDLSSGERERLALASVAVAEPDLLVLDEPTRGLDPERKEGELALLFLRLYRSLDALVGGDDLKARLWLHTTNDHLGGIPSDRIRTVEGLIDVVQYLDAMRGRL